MGRDGPTAGRAITVSRTIHAPASRIFGFLCDPAMHPRIDGSGSVRAVLPGGPARLGPGTRFGMDMKLGGRYKILNTVVEYDQDRLIAWRHAPRNRSPPCHSHLGAPH